jgi:hypothetical protein
MEMLQNYLRFNENSREMIELAKIIENTSNKEAIL